MSADIYYSDTVYPKCPRF